MNHMTKEQRLALLVELEDKAFEKMAEVPVESQDLVACMAAVINIRNLAENVAYAISPEKILTELLNETENVVPVNVASPVVEEAEVVEEVVEEVPVPAMSKDEAKKILVELAQAGVDVNGVMAEMGFAKLSLVPADKYAELIAKCKEAK